MKDLFTQFFATKKIDHYVVEKYNEMGRFFLMSKDEVGDYIQVTEEGVAFLGLAVAELNYEFNRWAAEHGHNRVHLTDSDDKTQLDFLIALMTTVQDDEIDMRLHDGKPAMPSVILVLSQHFSAIELTALIGQANAMLQLQANETNPHLH